MFSRAEHDAHTKHSGRLRNLPVNKRLHEVAEIAKQLLGPKRVEATTQISKDTLRLNLVVKGAKRGGVSELNMELLQIIVEEALCMELCALRCKGEDIVVRFSGLAVLAEDAEAESASRKRRRDAAGAFSKGVFALASMQLVRAVKVLHRNRCPRVWDAYVQAAELYTVQCARTWRALGWMLVCMTLLFVWLLSWSGCVGRRRLRNL